MQSGIPTVQVLFLVLLRVYHVRCYNVGRPHLRACVVPRFFLSSALTIVRREAGSANVDIDHFAPSFLAGTWALSRLSCNLTIASLAVELIIRNLSGPR